jgi:hypothetical protein
MSITDLGTGEPFAAGIINTQPRQLRFIRKANEDYQIRAVYLANPPAISADSDSLYVQDMYAEGVYLSFVRLVALSVGEEELANRYRVYYEDWLNKNRRIAQNKNKNAFKLRFNWL